MQNQPYNLQLLTDKYKAQSTHLQTLTDNLQTQPTYLHTLPTYLRVNVNKHIINYLYRFSAVLGKQITISIAATLQSTQGNHTELTLQTGCKQQSFNSSNSIVQRTRTKRKKSNTQQKYWQYVGNIINAKH